MKKAKTAVVWEVSFDRLGEMPERALRWSKEGLYATAGIAEERNGRLWIGFADGGLQCLESATGREIWKTSIGYLPVVGVQLHEGWVIAWNQGGGVLWCDRETGEKPCARSFTTGLAGPPFCVGDWMVVGTIDGTVARLDLRKDGSAAWMQKHDQGLRSAPKGEAASAEVSEQGEGLLLAGISGSGQLLLWEAKEGNVILSRDIGATEAIGVDVFENTEIFVMDQAGDGEKWSYEEENETWKVKRRQGILRSSALCGVTHHVPVWKAFQEYVFGTAYGEVVRRSVLEGVERWRVQMPDPLLRLERREGNLVVCGRAGSVVWLDIWKGRPLCTVRLPRTPQWVRVLGDGGILVSDTSGGLLWYRSGWWKRTPTATTSARRKAPKPAQPKFHDAQSLASPQAQTTAPSRPNQAKTGSTTLFWLGWEGGERLVPAEDILNTSATKRIGTPIGSDESVGIEVLCERLSDRKQSDEASRRLVELGPEALSSLWPELSNAGMFGRMAIQDTMHKIAQKHRLDLLFAWTERSMAVLFHPPALVPMLEMLLFWPAPDAREIKDALLPLQGLCEAPTGELKDAWARVQQRYPSLDFDFFSPPTPEQAKRVALRQERTSKAPHAPPAWETVHGQADAQDTGFFAKRLGPTSHDTRVAWSGMWRKKAKAKEQIQSPKALCLGGVVVVLNPDGTEMKAWNFPKQANQGMFLRWEWPSHRAISNFAMWEDAVLVRYQDGTLEIVRGETGEVLWGSDIPRDINLLLPERDSLYTLRQDRDRWLLRAERMKALWSLEKVWEVTLGKERPSTLILSRSGDLVVNGTEGMFRVHRAEDGAFVYEKKHPALGRCWLIGAEEGVLFANKAGDYGCLDDQGEVRWQDHCEYRLGGAPVYAEGQMYLTNEDGDVYGVDAETGKTRIMTHTSSPFGGAVIAGNVLFVCNESSAYGMDRRNNDQLWRKPISGPLSWRPPVVWDRKLLVFDLKGKMHLLGT